MPTHPIDLTAAVDIEAPAAVVWSVVADYDHDPSWRQGVETMDPAPSGSVVVGTTTREVLRFAGRTLRNEGRVEAVEPGRSFTWRTHRGVQASGSRTVEPLGPDRCQMVLRLLVEPKPSERLMVPILRRMMRRTLAGDARRLAARVEELVAMSSDAG
jgi:uncharacterized protein YndB with AHSA1/START domain